MHKWQLWNSCRRMSVEKEPAPYPENRFKSEPDSSWRLQNNARNSNFLGKSDPHHWRYLRKHNNIPKGNNNCDVRQSVFVLICYAVILSPIQFIGDDFPGVRVTEHIVLHCIDLSADGCRVPRHHGHVYSVTHYVMAWSYDYLVMECYFCATAGL